MSNLKQLKNAAAALGKHALTYPETVEDFPWGHSAMKVKGKIFLSTYVDEDTGTLSLSVKLPISGPMALTLPFASPTRYGLGPSGWVTSQFKIGDEVPMEMLKEWVDESFRAVAPKRIVAMLEGEFVVEASKRRKKRKTTS